MFATLSDMSMVRIIALIFFVSNLSYAEDEIQIIDVKPRPLKSEDVAKRTLVGDVRAGGTVTDVCRLQEYRNLYTPEMGLSSAKKDFSEGEVKYYGVANGIGPVSPGERCKDYKVFKSIVLWPTEGCNYDLTFDQAYEFARAYNRTVFQLVCRSST